MCAVLVEEKLSTGQTEQKKRSTLIEHMGKGNEI